MRLLSSDFRDKKNCRVKELADPPVKLTIICQHRELFSVQGL